MDYAAGQEAAAAGLGGQLVAFFRFGAESSGYAVYAHRESEIVRNLESVRRREALDPLSSDDFKVIFPRARRRVNASQNPVLWKSLEVSGR